ncbi:hypothetical protein GQ55_1G225100 [Panicum hallii var. hallii]|uniref:Uncharacterized protein n=1 Tax=Panicum hallii var. hallii TaxID=1504633 RepID=A0A2T7F6L4_9POAL|nr:hypothetical protein GQ55_1G225100 [Panicum hallii var. hallii]
MCAQTGSATAPSLSRAPLCCAPFPASLRVYNPLPLWFLCARPCPLLRSPPLWSPAAASPGPICRATPVVRRRQEQAAPPPSPAFRAPRPALPCAAPPAAPARPLPQTSRPERTNRETSRQNG